MRRPTTEQIIWFVALICGVAPLWAAQAIPLVDLPQHLHLISVLHRLDDASTLYPEIFARRPELTPYLGYYYVVSLLNWLLPLELANRVFLSAVVAGLPLSLAFLLKSLKRPTWPALLALPFAWGDSFAWGFVNYCASLPLAILTCGFFVRVIDHEPGERRKWGIGVAISLVLVLLFHVQSFIFLAFALPLLLLTTPAPEGKNWRARIPALVSVSPAVLIFFVWFGARLNKPPEIAPGQPWKAWGPMFSKENVAWKSFDQNLAEFVTVPRNQAGGIELQDTQFPVLAGMTPDGSDQRAVRLVFLIAIAGVITRLAQLRAKSNDTQEGKVARWRIVALCALAFALLFLTPFDIRGFVYAMNTRYAHLAAALLVAAVPVLPEKWAQRYLIAAGLAALVLMAPLWTTIRAFQAEYQSLERLALSAGDKPRVMGLIWSTGSRAMTHPLFLHSACVVARERGGLTNFSFASTPHSPLMYQGAPPPTFPSEWRPGDFRYDQYGRYYDHFVIRGARPEQVFGRLLETELYVAAQEGDFFLVRRRSP
ncbi:MAG: hypothetical protein QM817_09600 [Archangium sp.]